MRDWNKDFRKLMEAMDKEAGYFGRDNKTAYDAYMLLVSFIEDYELGQCTGGAKYDDREYKVVMSNIEAFDLCDAPYFKDIYQI